MTPVAPPPARRRVARILLPAGCAAISLAAWLQLAGCTPAAQDLDQQRLDDYAGQQRCCGGGGGGGGGGGM
jgi:hypothetical protein